MPSNWARYRAWMAWRAERLNGPDHVARERCHPIGQLGRDLGVGGAHDFGQSADRLRGIVLGPDFLRQVLIQGIIIQRIQREVAVLSPQHLCQGGFQKTVVARMDLAYAVD